MRSLVVTTSGPIVDKENYVAASLTVDGTRYSGRMRGRGNYTWLLPKKPYKVKLDKSTAMFGFPASKDWALLANMLDESAMRTAIAFEIGRRLGRWTPRSVFCELTLNGSYEGVYQFIESVEVQSGRLEIREMKAGDVLGLNLTGPYVLEQDAYFTDPGWITPLGGVISYDVPDVVGVSQQEAYIQNWINGFERLLVTGDVAWLQYAELTSWADWYLLQELTKNLDSQWFKSCKFYKDQGHPGKAVLWPPWDFDMSIGAWSSGPIEPTGWWTREITDFRNNWLHYAALSPVFIGVARSRWHDLFLPAMADIGDFITALSADLADALGRDRARWFNHARAPYHDTGYLNTWLSRRRDWMTANL